jgi:hypothetical protein
MSNKRQKKGIRPPREHGGNSTTKHLRERQRGGGRENNSDKPEKCWECYDSLCLRSADPVRGDQEKGKKTQIWHQSFVVLRKTQPTSNTHDAKRKKKRRRAE